MIRSVKDIIFEEFMKEIDSIEFEKSTYITKEGKTSICLMIIESENLYRKFEISEEEYQTLEKGILSI